jgi:membrane protease subunit HflC
MRLIIGFVIVIAVVLVVFIPEVFFVVDETDQAIVTRFGEAQRSAREPGLYLKTPFMDRVIYLDKRLLLFDAPPDSLLTKDKKRLIIDVYARGRIVDPLKFIEEVATEARGKQRAIEIISSELRREIGLDDQSEIIEASREQIMANLREAVRPKLAEFGIEIVDVRMKRADFPVEIAASVHERMKAERKRKADKERAEGAKKDLEVRADVDKQATIIRSAAKRDADIIRGCGEAEAIMIFAEALEQDPEFYTFQRSLEMYAAALSEDTTIIGESSDLGSMFEVIRNKIVEASSLPTSVDSNAMGTTELESRCGQLDAEGAGRKFLSEYFEISLHAFVLNSVSEMEWPDQGLGCPVEGQSYDQVDTQGYVMIFEQNNDKFEVHTDVEGLHVVICGA